MFRALGRWVKAISYLFTGQIDAARRVLDTNPYVVQAKYEDILREKLSRIHQYKQAVAGLVAQQENKMGKVKTLTEEVERLERLKAGALAKAKQRVDALKGKTKEEIQEDAEYKKCLSAFNDFTSTLAEKQERITEIEADVRQYDERLKDHKVQLLQLAREIDGLKSEASGAVADMISAKQEKSVADAFSGIADDATSKELERMRQLRQEVRAEVKVSQELAGTDSKRQEAEFLEYARTSSANSVFDALIGLADKVETKDTTTTQREAKITLPE